MRCSCSGCSPRLAASAVIGTMLVALITNHRGNGFFIFRPGEGWEYVMTLVIVGFADRGRRARGSGRSTTRSTSTTT